MGQRARQRRIGIFNGPGEQGKLLAEHAGDRIVTRRPFSRGAASLLEPGVEFGADAFSFGEGVQLEDGDVMQVCFDGFGRALRNPLRRAIVEETLVSVRPL